MLVSLKSYWQYFWKYITFFTIAMCFITVSPPVHFTLILLKFGHQFPIDTVLILSNRKVVIQICQPDRVSVTLESCVRTQSVRNKGIVCHIGKYVVTAYQWSSREWEIFNLIPQHAICFFNYVCDVEKRKTCLHFLTVILSRWNHSLWMTRTC